MSYVAMALSLVNALIVAAWQNHGLRVAGVNGLDGGVLTASPRGSQWGRAGDTPHVDVSLLNLLMAARIVPVINPIASDGAGGLLNCNADTAAGAIAGALGADLILLSDVDQIRREATDPTTGVAHATGSEIRALIQSGEIRDGMVPKVNAALDALAGGAPRVLMANGTRAHALANVLTGKGLWTEVVP
jgi:acetylglutamate kinase